MRSDNGTIKQTLCSPIVLAKLDQSFRFLSEDGGNTLSRQIRYFGVLQMDFFCSGVQLYLLLSPYIGFISFNILMFIYWEMMHIYVRTVRPNQTSMQLDPYQNIR